MTKNQEKLIALGSLTVTLIATETLKVFTFKRGAQRVLGRELSWMQALWVTSLIRTTGALLEEGRRNAVKQAEAVDSIKETYGK